MTSMPQGAAEVHAPAGASAVARVADLIARWVLIIFFGLFPFFVAPLPWVTIPQAKILLAGSALIIALVAWVLARLFAGEMRVPRSALLYASALLPAAYLASAVASGFTATSLVGTGTEQGTLAAVVIWYAFFALTALVFFHHRSDIRLMLRSFFLGVLALEAIEVLYMFFPAHFSLGGALQGATGNPLGSWHDLGILAGVSFFLAFALFRSGIMGGYWRALPVALGLFSAFFLIVIHFADVFWGAGALALAGFIAVVRAAVKADGASLTDGMMRGLPWFLVGAAMVLLGLFTPQVSTILPAPIQRAEIEVRPSWQGTLDVAKQSLGAPTALLFGSGPNSFIREWGLHKPQGVNLTPFWNADFHYGIGAIPTSVFSVGLFGLLAWGALLLVLLGLLLRIAWEVRPLTPGRTLFAALLAAVAYLVAFHMIYTPGIAVTVLTFVLMGLLAVAALGDAPARTIRIGAGGLSALLALVLTLGLGAASGASAYYAGREALSNAYVNKGAYIFQTSQDVGGAGEAIGTALAIAPQNDVAHRAAAELGIAELARLIQNANPDDAARAQLQETLQSTIQHALAAVEIDGSNYGNWLSLAQIYSDLAGASVQGALENAKTAYEKASAAQPANPVPKLRLAQIAAAQNDLPAARENLQQALALKPDFAAAYYLLSQVEAASGNGDAAVTAAGQAVQLVPDDPVGWFNLGYIFYAGASYDNAAAALREAVSRAPDYANALFILGLSYNAQGRTDEALAAFARVAELNPGETWMSQLIENVKAKIDPFAGIANGQAATQ